MNKPEDVGDPLDVKKRKERIKSADAQALDDLREVLNTRAGRATIWRVLARCEPLAINRRTDNSVFQIEGRREIGLWLISELTRVDPHAYIRLQIEAEAQARRNHEGN